MTIFAARLTLICVNLIRPQIDADRFIGFFERFIDCVKYLVVQVVLVINAIYVTARSGRRYLASLK